MAANITKITTPWLVTPSPLRRTVVAGEALPVACPVYIHSDGKAYKAVSTACTIANLSKFDGIVVQAAGAGDTVTVHGVGVRIHIAASGLTIGSFWYVSATAGAFYDAKVATADTNFPIAKAESATDIACVRPPL